MQPSVGKGAHGEGVRGLGEGREGGGSGRGRDKHPDRSVSRLGTEDRH